MCGFLLIFLEFFLDVLQPLENLGLDPQEAAKLAVNTQFTQFNIYAYLTCKYQTFKKLLRKLLQRIILNTRSGVLLNTLLIPTDLFCA